MQKSGNLVEERDSAATAEDYQRAGTAHKELEDCLAKFADLCERAKQVISGCESAVNSPKAAGLSETDIDRSD